MCLRGLSHSLLERLRLVRFFPSYGIQIIDASEMTVVGCFAIDRTKQIELLDNFRRFEVENFPDCPLEFFFVDFAGTKSIDADANGLGMTDGVSVDTFCTGKVDEEKLERAIWEVFNFKPAEIIKQLNLLRPIYRKTTNYGH